MEQRLDIYVYRLGCTEEMLVCQPNLRCGIVLAYGSRASDTSLMCQSCVQDAGAVSAVTEVFACIVCVE